MYGMEARERFRMRTDSTSGESALSFDELVEMLYRVLRNFPEAGKAVEEAFLAMAKQARNGAE